MSARGVITLDASGSNGISFENFVRGGFLAGQDGNGFPTFDNGLGFSGTEMFLPYGTTATSKYILARGGLGYDFDSHVVWGSIGTIEYGTRGGGSFNPSGSFVGGNVELKITNLTFSNPLPTSPAELDAIRQFGSVHNFSAAHMYGQNFDAARIARYADELDQFAQEFIGSSGNDTYTGTAFDDIIRGGGGNDAFDGGGGNDIIFFSGNKAGYTITKDGGNVLISAGGWTTTVTNVEYARFGDAYVKLSDLSQVGVGTSPYDLALATSSIDEDAAVGTVVSTISSKDDDAGDSVTYTLATDASGLFEIVGNELRVRKALDYETATSHEITIRMIDAQGNIAFQTLTVNVNDVDDTDEPPHSLALSATSVVENVPVGTVVGVLSAVDPDSANLAYRLLSDSSGLFEIVDNELRVKKAVDYEKVQKATITVEVSDGTTAVTRTFTIAIKDVLETITGTAKSETLRGGIGADKILGEGGNDMLLGYGGGDLLYGGAGNDILIGGAGADKLYGGSGIDTASYAGATRTVVASLAKPSMNANDAKGDTYSSIENLTGSSHADRLYGNSGHNTIDGGAGNDRLYGGAGNDTLKGATGNDLVYGDAGNDKLYGGAGNDQLFGGVGNDKLYGDAGNDTLRGGAGNDQLFGGAGNDKLYGDAGNDALRGGAGNDQLFGGAGNDKLYGDAGNDKLRGDAGNDYLYGGAGNDQLFGGAGNDRLYGDAGNDKLYGDAGNDTLEGGAGKDFLYGGAGNDRLIGGLGADHLYGGAGRDTFVFQSLKDSTVGSAGRDTIHDFNGRAGDRIDVRAIDADTTAGGNQAFAFIGTDSFSKTAGELRYESKGGATFVYGDVNGDGKADFAVRLDKAMTLSEGYFLL